MYNVNGRNGEKNKRTSFEYFKEKQTVRLSSDPFLSTQSKMEGKEK